MDYNERCPCCLRLGKGSELDRIVKYQLPSESKYRHHVRTCAEHASDMVDFLCGFVRPGTLFKVEREVKKSDARCEVCFVSQSKG